MKIGLIDVDNFGKKKIRFPNLALMKISAWHKAQGDEVEWWWSDLIHYDKVYMSKVFSDTYSKDIPEPMNADIVEKGGTGYCISTVNGIEVFDKSKNKNLPDEIEHIMPDYSLYGITDKAYGFMSRGCPRGCDFCHVKSKEGLCSIKVADLSEFWSGQKHIELCDPNTLACKDWKDILTQLADSKAYVDMNQGVDIRLMNDEKAEYLSRIKLENIHFAWDNPQDKLEDRFRMWAERRGGSKDPHGHNGTVYCLTNFGDYTEQEHINMALYRIEALRGMGFRPYCMVYNKPTAPRGIRLLQRWCNNPFIFYSTPNFYDYDPSIG